MTALKVGAGCRRSRTGMKRYEKMWTGQLTLRMERPEAKHCEHPRNLSKETKNSQEPLEEHEDFH